uniref:Antitoxin component YafN of the YafNO toxin-antitoxin module, PHD/YefM family n=1 Tax=Candidatus Kentrum sp. LFY TaxID=2126342 RepID=A0A450U560_9GAMM|nr:MAG: Antitoxin component YafN of the YafNO toxin-antitoxin module, PHD/YefM family [Candidatus Kentron sp. LFY]
MRLRVSTSTRLDRLSGGEAVGEPKESLLDVHEVGFDSERRSTNDDHPRSIYDTWENPMISVTTMASVFKLKEDPLALLSAAANTPVAICDDDRPTAYLISAKTYEWMMEMLDDYVLLQIAKERQNQKDEAMEVKLDDL